MATDEPTTAAGRALLRWSDGRGGGYVDLAEVLAIEAEARREGAAEVLAAVDLAAVMSDAYTYEDDQPTLPFFDDFEAFWEPFAARVLAAVEAERKKAAETA